MVANRHNIPGCRAWGNEKDDSFRVGGINKQRELARRGNGCQTARDRGAEAFIW